MKCPVSMLPGGGSAGASVLFVIGILAAIAYAVQSQKTQQASKQ